MKYGVIVEQDEDGMYVTEVPSLQECISQGKKTCKGYKEYSTSY